MDEQLVVGGLAGAQGALLHPDDVACTRDLIGTGIVVNKANQMRVIAREISGRQVWPVIQLGNRLLDFFASRVTNVRFVVDHARHGLDGNAGKFGYVIDCGFGHGRWVAKIL